MTLQEAKEQIARDLPFGYDCWFEMCLHLKYTNSNELLKMCDAAAELYARAKWDEALDAVKRLNPYKTDTVWAIDESEIDAIKLKFNGCQNS